MAQVYFITRGLWSSIDKWITHLKGKWFPWKYNGQDGILEGMLRPIQLWEFAYPKEYRDIVLNTIFDGQPDVGKHQSNWKGNLGLKAIQKALGAKSIKPWDTTKGKLPMDRQGMSVMGIGERDDQENTHPATGIKNEGI